MKEFLFSPDIVSILTNDEMAFVRAVECNNYSISFSCYFYVVFLRLLNIFFVCETRKVVIKQFFFKLTLCLKIFTTKKFKNKLV